MKLKGFLTTLLAVFSIALLALPSAADNRQIDEAVWSAPPEGRLTLRARAKKKKKTPSAKRPDIRIVRIGANYFPYRLCTTRTIEDQGPLECFKPGDQLPSLRPVLACSDSVIRFIVTIKNQGGDFPKASEKPRMKPYLKGGDKFAEFQPMLFRYERLGILNKNSDIYAEGSDPYIHVKTLKSGQEMQLEFYRMAMRSDAPLNPYTVAVHLYSPLFDMGKNEQKVITWTPVFNAPDFVPVGGQIFSSDDKRSLLSRYTVQNIGGPHPAGFRLLTSVQLAGKGRALFESYHIGAVGAGESVEVSEIGEFGDNSVVEIGSRVENTVALLKCPNFEGVNGTFSEGPDANQANNFKISAANPVN